MQLLRKLQPFFCGLLLVLVLTECGVRGWRLDQRLQSQLGKEANDKSYWMILTLPRSGSSLLAAVLDLPSLGICSAGEVMNMEDEWRTPQVIQWYENTTKIGTSNRSSCHYIGHKTFPGFFDQNIDTFFSELSNWQHFANFKVIYLLRTETVQQALSHREASTVGKWAGGALDDEKVTLDAKSVFGTALHAMATNRRITYALDRYVPQDNRLLVLTDQVFNDLYAAQLRCVAFLLDERPEEIEKKHEQTLRDRLAAKKVSPLRKKKLTMNERFADWPQLKQDLLSLAKQTYQPKHFIQELLSLS